MGSSKARTVGYRYSLGAHLALCHGPVDAIREIRVDDRTAWSIGSGQNTGQSTSQGAGVGAQVRYGTLDGLFATAAGSGETAAMLQFTGILAGIRIGQSYDLQLQTDNTTRSITVGAISYDADSDTTTWQIEPADTAFASQSAEVTDALNPPALNSGATGGRIRIDKPDLFGGEKREGGIVGDIDVLTGAPDQMQNDYFAANAGTDVPGYRGICSLVLRQVYLGLNPYLKPWAVRLTRILKAQDGAPQWYSEKAQILPEVRIGDAAIYIAMDSSGSMSGTRMAAQIAAVSRLVEEIGANTPSGPDSAPNDIRIITWNSTVSGSFERRDADATAYGELKDWVDALPNIVSGGTDFGVAVSQAAAFFNGAGSKRRILIFVTDGEPSPAASLQTAITTLSGIADVDVFAFNIALAKTDATAQIDNTAVDGVPVVPPGDPEALVASLRAAFGQGPDMNSAHIIRECLTNADWGLGHGSADIGESFAAAADTLFAEGFGLSLLWQRESTIEDFISDILHHIDAYLYVDRRSGRWELRLIRDDYDPDSLPVFDATNVVDWGELGRREPADLVNSITVRFSDARTDQTGSVSVTDTALVQTLGQVISATVDYPGIRFESLAVRVAERDLRVLSAPLLSGEITVSRIRANLDPGDVIRLSNPRRGLEGVVVRIIEIDHGDGRKNGVRLKIAEDVFALGRTALVGGESTGPASLIRPPKLLNRRMVMEAPYWLLVQELGHAQADTLLADDPDAGALIATGERPSADALSAQVWSDSGAGYTLQDPVAFAPSALLAADIGDDPAERTITVEAWSGLNEVTTGTLAAIGNELVRIDEVSATSLSLGRGCLDTVPQPHPAGTPVICWQQLANASEAAFAAGETVGVKMLPETGFGTLPLAQAPEDTVTLASRAIRPLPPGNLRGNGVSVVNPNTLNLGPILLTWSHRDRLAQTSLVFDAYDAGDIGPEPGVSYTAEIRWVDPDTDTTLEPPAKVIDAGTANSLTLTKDDIPILTAPTGTKHFEVQVQARRTTGSMTYEAWQARSIRLFMPDGIKLAEASLWIGLGAGARMTITEAELFLDRGGAAYPTLVETSLWTGFGSDTRATVADTALWIGFGGGAPVTLPAVDIFTERGGTAALTTPTTTLYIEVLS